VLASDEEVTGTVLTDDGGVEKAGLVDRVDQLHELFRIIDLALAVVGDLDGGEGD
jgi:hypothetical protein